MRTTRYGVPFCLAAALFMTILLILVRHGLRQDAGVFVYPLDDAYIHQAVSRNLALHGVWGISRYSFSGASSSPAWTLLLAGLIRVAGVHLLTPLVVNAVAAILLLAAAAAILAVALPRAGAIYITAALCLLVLVVPLPGLALIGMEHVVHSLAAMCLVAIVAWVASRAKGAHIPRSAVAGLMVGAAACGGLRYESCFMIAAGVALLALRKRFRPAVFMAAAAATGPVLYGVYSYAHSGIPLPFSVVMKSAGRSGHNPLVDLLTSDVSPIVLTMAVVFLARMARRASRPEAGRGPFWTFGQSFLAVALAAAAMQAMVGPVGWLMRYEAYLYALGVVAVALAVGEELDVSAPGGRAGAERWAVLAVLVASVPLGGALVHRVHHGWSDIAASTRDRYVEHLGQALFVADAMPKAAVVANDIGFLSYYAPDANILDPLGLGSIEPVRLKRAHRAMTPEFTEQWAARENAQLAILHDDFPGMEAMIPSGWVLVESWCFPHNLVFQNHVESFYAPDMAAAAVLRERMAQFQDVAPEIVRYRFPQDGKHQPMPERGVYATCPVPESVSAHSSQSAR